MTYKMRFFKLLSESYCTVGWAAFYMNSSMR